MANDLVHFLFGGSTKDRELRETRRAWDETQALWRGSPLGRMGVRDLALALVGDLTFRAERAPVPPILVAACEAVEALYGAEDVGDLEARWQVIEESAEAAVEFRQMLPRRRRWACDYAQMNGVFERVITDTFSALFASFPECCFPATAEERGDSFEAPLLDLLDDPVAAVERLLMLPYDNDALRLKVFYKLRELCAGNVLVASGFLRSDDIYARERKLVLPAAQKNKTGAELSELYLNGSPLKALLDVPVPFRIPDELRFEHCHIVGGTGHGKTQLMQKMIHADLVASQQDGRSVVVIDSQGDLINKLVRLELFSPDVPDSLAERLVVIDPADVEFPAALNLFDAHLDRVRDYSAVDRERVLNGVIELYELFFGAFLGAELTQKQGVIFKYLARLMLAIPDATIHTLMKIMEDGRPYKSFMDKLDGSARYFFETEFFQPSFAATKKQVLRRLWGVLSTPAFERMFTQPKNKLDLFEAMNEGKIILVSTAKDLLKREGSQLLGRFFIAMIAQAALERSTIPEHRRNAAFVYVDEAQEYFDDSIETILNQARKYRVGLTIAHQTLDQLSPRLRSGILTNTSMKCAGGVSSKDARALADELRTTPEFIESMKRRGPRSEFAVWVKNLTGQAIRLSVPLGFLERQPTLAEEDYDALLAANRARYCGTLADVAVLSPATVIPEAEAPAKPAPSAPVPPERAAREPEARQPVQPPQPGSEPPSAPVSPHRAAEPERAPTPPPRPAEDRQLGKGGAKHRYLQALVKKLAEEQELKATLEAPLPGGGQVDVLIERDGVVAAVEISVTTGADYDRDKLRRCLAASYPRVAVVVAKSKGVQARYNAAVVEGLSEEERARVSVLTPEEVPDFIAALAPPPEPSETIVKGYRVRVSHVTTSSEDAKARRERLAQVIAQSLRDTKE